ncbi:PCYCGC motif-containing (lipo)protein [Lysinibacillus sp. 54212]|uniref:PCYCGC motif-containing (lipo)protein n=1 Tax=Lysinibacillus sp. 54212 TaxID=3119829 RepID=UPI002FC5AE16
MKKLSFLLASVLFLSACTSEEPSKSSNDENHKHEEQYVTGDIQEETASAEVLPSFLDNHNETMRLAYQVAGQAPDVLKWMPCYCGCGESAGHGSNLNCFIQEVREDGSIVWDDHGTRCIVCVEIALNSVKMHKDGKSLKEIRNSIDETYKEGYAKPTQTEMPA